MNLFVVVVVVVVVVIIILLFKMSALTLMNVLVVIYLLLSVARGDYSSLDEILRQGVVEEVYTGAVAIVGTADGKYLYAGTVGNFNYLDEDASSPNVTLNTLFDLASVSKVQFSIS